MSIPWVIVAIVVTVAVGSLLTYLLGRAIAGELQGIRRIQMERRAQEEQQ